MGFCSCTAKFFLFVFNLIITILSIALMVIGGIAISRENAMQNGNFDNLRAPAIGIIVVGVIIFLIAFMGCCGAIQESSCLITSYAVILLVIVIIEVIFGILAFVYRGQIEKEVNNYVDNQFRHHLPEMQDMQKAFQCCGYNGPQDYPLGGILPDSCCDGTSPCTIVSKHLFKEGCKDKVIDFLKKYLKYIGGIAIGFAVVEVLGVCFALYLASRFRRENKGF